MPKKNGFVMFMEARRPQLLAAGHDLTGGTRDLVVLCGHEWMMLPEDEKRKYVAEAKLFNEQRKEKAECQLSSKGQEGPSTVQGTSAAASKKQPQASIIGPYRFTDEDSSIFQANQEIVHKMFGNAEWISQPIVICSFSMYLEPDLRTLFLPAEVGLAAMTLKDGVIDNYARIIEPGPIPKGHGIEAVETAEKLGLPEIGTVRELADLQPLMMIIESFFITYKGDLEGKQLYVFAFDSDFLMVRRCFQWLSEITHFRLPVTVLSLNLYALKASNLISSSIGTDASGLDSICRGVNSLTMRPRKKSAKKSPGLYREPGKPLTGSFIYASNHSGEFAGVFVSKEDVEKCVKDMDNYKYYEEICCVYHMLSGTQVYNCALNRSNRYAFGILEYLTIRSGLAIKRGAHYPEIDKPWLEKRRRANMISRWGLTQMEEEMLAEEDRLAREKMEMEKKAEPEAKFSGPSNGTQSRGRSRRRDEESHERERRRRRRDQSDNCGMRARNFNQWLPGTMEDKAPGGEAGPSNAGSSWRIPRPVRSEAQSGNSREFYVESSDSKFDSLFRAGKSLESTGRVELKGLGHGHVPLQQQERNSVPRFGAIPVFFHFGL